MPTRHASAVWEGNLKAGKGRMKFGSGAFDGAFSFASRFEEGTGTNPEELIGAALAGCFSMALSNNLDKAGHAPRRVDTKARVNIEKGQEGFRITSITLQTEANVPGIDEKIFMEQAEATKKTCPVSKALTGTEIKLEAKLVQS
ncbi:MAG: OsmC family protein [candidate division KSB1 bacterium]|nr:OsmC family protein [candidate division KSB1 bacterium]